MKYCPECNGPTAVNDVRHDSDMTYRKRKCTSCGHVFFTIEFEAEDTEQFRKEWGKVSRKPSKPSMTVEERREYDRKYYQTHKRHKTKEG